MIHLTKVEKVIMLDTIVFLATLLFCVCLVGFLLVIFGIYVSIEERIQWIRKFKGIVQKRKNSEVIEDGDVV